MRKSKYYAAAGALMDAALGSTGGGTVAGGDLSEPLVERERGGARVRSITSVWRACESAGGRGHGRGQGCNDAGGVGGGAENRAEEGWGERVRDGFVSRKKGGGGVWRREKSLSEERG